MKPAGPRAQCATLVAALVGLALAPPVSAQLADSSKELDGRAVALRAEANLRGDRTYFEATLSVARPRQYAPREVDFESWAEGEGHRAFVRIAEPRKDRGIAFLRLPPELWMYLPEEGRSLPVPASMASEAWMGSDFTNDDLLGPSRVDDYEHRLLGLDEQGISAGGLPCNVVEYVPKAGVSVGWGRIVAWIEVETGAPLRQEFFDRAGKKLRVLTFEEIREVGSRHVPHRWVATPVDQPGHQSKIEIETIRFDEPIADEVFTQRNLRSRY